MRGCWPPLASSPPRMPRPWWAACARSPPWRGRAPSPSRPTWRTATRPSRRTSPSTSALRVRASTWGAPATIRSSPPCASTSGTSWCAWACAWQTWPRPSWPSPKPIRTRPCPATPTCGGPCPAPSASGPRPLPRACWKSWRPCRVSMAAWTAAPWARRRASACPSPSTGPSPPGCWASPRSNAAPSTSRTAGAATRSPCCSGPPPPPGCSRSSSGMSRSTAWRSSASSSCRTPSPRGRASCPRRRTRMWWSWPGAAAASCGAPPAWWSRLPLACPPATTGTCNC